MNIELARETVRKFVMEASHNTYWNVLVEKLIPILGIRAKPSKRKAFCSEARQEILRVSPNSNDSKEAWESGVAAWTTPEGIDKVIQCVVDLARLKRWLD